MKVEEFLERRPCLEELDGYLEGLRWQIENAGACLPLTDDLRSSLGELPDSPLQPQYPEITTDLLAPIEAYRKQLLKGKVVPYPSRIDRKWVYKLGSKPKLAKRKKGR